MFREFRKETGRNSRPNVWLIGIDTADPEFVVTRWGLLDGAIQETRDRPGPCGTEGYADYQDAKAYAVFCMNRDIRKKTEQGYVEWVDGKPIAKVATVIDFVLPLPKNLSFYKPQTKIEAKKFSKLHAAGRAIWTLKRDGMMHVAVRRQDRWEIYSRRMDLATDRFPHIVESLDKLRLPNGTILLGEMVLLKSDGRDDFKGVGRICRSDPDLALAYQGLGSFPKNHDDKVVLGKAAYYVFDIAFLNGKDGVREKEVHKRLSVLRDIFMEFDPSLSANATGQGASIRELMAESKKRERMLRIHHVAPLKIFHASPETDLDIAKALGLEGFVVLDADAVYGSKGYSFDGKAQRPNGIWKRKPKCEDEFIVVGMYGGTGKNMDKLGGFCLEQIHPDTGLRISCGNCGGGFTDDQRDEFLAEKDAWIGKTIKVEFDYRQPSNDGVYALRFPVFKGPSDKTPEECVAQGLPEDDDAGE
jgi:ATP-dependent DNA ligase